MTTKKFTDLPAAASVLSTDIVAVVNLTDGTTRKALVSQLASGFTAGGDLMGTTTSQTVAKVKGTTITTAGGSLPIGAVLRTTAGGTADWGAVNLADTDAVTGTLPLANMASPTGSGVAKVSGDTWASAASTIVDADVSATAAISGSKLQAASGSNAGSMSASDKTKLDNMQPEGAAVAIAALAIDWSAGSVFTKTLSSGASTFTFSNATSGRMITVRVTGSSSIVTWPTVKWAGGVAPTQTASGTDIYTFFHDGTNIYGSVVQAMA